MRHFLFHPTVTHVVLHMYISSIVYQSKQPFPCPPLPAPSSVFPCSVFSPTEPDWSAW